MKNQDVTVPFDLFMELKDNTVECFNSAINNQDFVRANNYKLDIDECYKVLGAINNKGK